MSPVHVPAWSAVLPVTTARQAPLHPDGDFDAPQAPPVTVLPCASTSVHVPLTVPLAVSGTTVHVPVSVRPELLLALHVFTGTACAADLSAATKNSRHRRKKNFRVTCCLELRNSRLWFASNNDQVRAAPHDGGLRFERTRGLDKYLASPRIVPSLIKIGKHPA